MWLSISAVVLRSLAALMSILLTLVVARYLGTINYGYYSVAYSIMLACTILSKIGMDGALLRFVPKLNKSKQLLQVREIIYASHIYSLVGSLIILVILNAVFISFRDQNNAFDSHDVIVCSIFLLVYTQYLIIESQLVSFGKTLLSQILSVVTIAIAIMLILFAGQWYPSDLKCAGVFSCLCLSHGVVAFAGACCVSVAITESGTCAQCKINKQWLISGALFAVVNFLNYIQLQSGPVFCGIIGGPEIAAHYSVIVKLGIVVLLGQQAITMLEASNISRLLCDERDRYRLVLSLRRVTFRCVLMGVISTLAVIIFAPFALQLFGNDYTGCYTSIVMLAFGLMLTSSFGPLNQVVYLSGHQSDCIVAYLLNSLCFAIFSVLLIPSMGAAGGVVASFLSRLLLMITLLFIVKWRLGINPLFIFGVNYAGIRTH
ncbi:lipopolysaccharide biosynthesis protein [Rubinisphaera italica]|uniref:Polysaccharide biosynthesis protein n=1 Tax=Rubinisphaera italica TaxID=2527969 RepID=A0A5C5XA03_9PLAN|nr:oligosaccharide flippase family protein [Rubinisphaera italica]TWT59608.1 Polysaccharide biosynthesis protein [Rubinisphaera italica]